MPDVVDSLFASLKKLPGQIVGGPVDLANIVAGGYKNIADAVVGNPVLDSNFTPKPVGGSEWINEKFGLGGPSSGLVEDSASAVLGVLANPSLLATKIGAAATAIAPKAAVIIAAHLTKTPEEMLAATRALRKGENAASVFMDTGMYRGPLDNKLRAVISDANSKLKPEALGSYAPDGVYLPKSVYGEKGTGVALKNKDLDKPLVLSDVLDHPELYKVYPDLANLEIRDNPYVGFGGAGFSRASTTASNIEIPARISMGLFGSEDSFHSAILHEVQHAIQNEEGFMSGGNSRMFRSPEELGQLDKSDKTFRTIAQEAKIALVDTYQIEPWKVSQAAAEIETGSTPYIGNALPDAFWQDENWLNYQSARKGQLIISAKKDEDYQKYLTIAGEAESRSVEKAFLTTRNNTSVTDIMKTYQFNSEGEVVKIPPSDTPFYPLSLYNVSPSELIPAPGQEHLVIKPAKP